MTTGTARETVRETATETTIGTTTEDAYAPGQTRIPA